MAYTPSAIHLLMVGTLVVGGGMMLLSLDWRSLLRKSTPRKRLEQRAFHRRNVVERIDRQRHPFKWAAAQAALADALVALYDQCRER